MATVASITKKNARKKRALFGGEASRAPDEAMHLANQGTTRSAF
jgi:hypothetical protein